MTDLVYSNARRQFGLQQWNWPALAVSAALVSSTYVPTLGDVYLDQIPSAAILVDGIVLTNLGISIGGAAQGIIPLIRSLELVTPVAALVLYHDTGNPATSELIYYSSGGIGFPFQAQGENFSIAFDQSNGGFFQI